MKIRWLFLLNVTLGILAGAAVTRLRLPDAIAEGPPISNSLPLNLLEPITVASIVVGIVGTLLATVHLGLGLRRARRRASALLRSTKQPLSPADWNHVLAPIHTLGQDGTGTSKRSSSSDTFSTLAPSITRARLLRLHWRHLALMQVWSSAALLTLEGGLITWWWRPSLNPSIAVAVLAPIALSILALLLLVAFTRLLIGDRIDRFIGALKWPLRAAPHDRSVSLGIAAPAVTERLVARSSAGTLPIRVDAPTPNPRSAEMRAREEGSRGASAKVGSPKSVPGAPVVVLEEVPPSSAAKTPALIDPQLLEIISAIDHLRAQQDAMKDAIQALAGALHGTADAHFEISQQIDTAPNWAPRLQELIENMIAHTEAIERETRQETSKLRDEIRERHDAQQRNIADVGASLNRLEARILPALRRVSSAHRALALMVERLSQFERNYARLDSINPERLEQGGSEQAHPGSKETGADHGIVSELKQLLSDLENATADPPSEIALKAE